MPTNLTVIHYRGFGIPCGGRLGYARFESARPESQMWKAFSSLRKNVWRVCFKQPADSRSANGRERDVERIRVLSVLQTAADRHVLTELSRRNGWQLFSASSRDQARDALRQTQIQIIFLDRDVDVVDWRSAVSTLAAASNGACVILISRVVDDKLWNEVVSNGGYDVVRKPLSEGEVLRNVKLAWSYWNGTQCRRTAPTK